MTDPLIQTLRWSTRPAPFDEGGRIVTVEGIAPGGRLADWNMAFTREEIETHSIRFFELTLAHMQEIILEFMRK